MTKRLGHLLLSLLLGGCAATSYEPVVVDSATPPSAGSSPRCSSLLKPGDECLTLVYANRWSTETGIQVESSGQVYCLKVPPHQVWFDKTRRHVPPDGEKGNWIMQLGDKRNPAGYFSLIVDVENAFTEEKSPTAVAVSALPTGCYRTEQAGKLVMYPNDAIGLPGDREAFYRNNAGHVWVQVRRQH